MGFRPNTRATIWGTPESISPTLTKLRVSISHKDKGTQEYKTDFSGFVGFCGSAIASKALSLKEKDRITLKRVDVTNKYDKEKKITYTNFWCYDFEPYVYNPGENDGGFTQNSVEKKVESVDSGELDEMQVPF